MKSLRENPFLRSLPGGPFIRWQHLQRPLLIAGCLSASAIVMRTAGICSCTVFALASFTVIVLSALFTGTSSFSAISGEREKKTLDSLRLTMLEPEDVIAGKLFPEFRTHCIMLLIFTPVMLVIGGLSEYGMAGGMAVICMAFLTGSLSLLAGFVLSCICRSTSQAVVAGTTLKAVWLLATPLLDMIIAAVIVSTTPPPLFSSINPLAALYALMLPQGMTGSWSILPWSFFFLAPLGLLALWAAAERLYMREGEAKAHHHRKMGELFRTGWAPAEWAARKWPFLSFLTEPAFLRELSLQLRHGAGRLPGYLVFIALFIGPLLYARSWGNCELASFHRHGGNRQAAQIVAANMVPAAAAQKSAEKIIATRHGYFKLHRHTLKGCLRWTMYQWAGIPLPADLIEDTAAEYVPGHKKSSSTSYVQRRAPDELTAPKNTSAASQAPAGSALDTAIIRTGLIGGMWLLILYLAIRGCCFTVAALTGEKDRRTWEDMALAGISPASMILGKLAGALIMPALQMTLVSPLLFIFTFSGTLSPLSVLSLYLYAMAMIFMSGMTGIWASASSRTTHEAQMKALALLLSLFFILPLATPLIWVICMIAVPLLLLLMLLKIKGLKPWFLMSLAAFIAPLAASPILTPLLFIVPMALISPLSMFPFIRDTRLIISLTNLLAALTIVFSLSVVFFNAAAGRISIKGMREVLAAEIPSGASCRNPR